MRRSLFLVTVLTFFFSQSGFSQSLEEGWKKMKPLDTGKKEVEKVFGKGDVDPRGYFGYHADGIFIQINYSTDPCKANQYNRGKYNVQPDTILDYSVHFNKEFPLQGLRLDRNRYVRQTSEHTPNQFLLISEPDGIMIVGEMLQDKELVGVIYFRPPKLVDAKFLCRNPASCDKRTN